MTRLGAFVWLLGGWLACGGSEPHSVTEPAVSVPSEAGAGYSLHEWGLLTVSADVVELAAGPGTQAPPPDMNIVVEKPVVYVHASGPARFSLRVHLGVGYALAERWPGAEAPIAWDVSTRGEACDGAIAYPSECTSADGYCEVRELARYETADASCLEVGSDRMSMLFYRLRAEPDVASRLPVQVDSGHVRANTNRIAWRVRHDSTGIRAWRVELTGEPADLPSGSAHGAPAAAAWMHHELERRGLSEDERRAFERAWWTTLFGTDMTQEGIVEDRVVEETPMEEVVRERGVQHDVDMLLYFLEDAEIAAIARLEASPSPTATRRAFVVRQLL